MTTLSEVLSLVSVLDFTHDIQLEIAVTRDGCICSLIQSLFVTDIFNGPFSFPPALTAADLDFSPHPGGTGVGA